MTCFTVNKFEDDIPVVLDTSLKRTSIDVYRKHTNTGQYVLFVSHERWPRKIASVRALNIAPFSNICDIVISFTNNTTEKLPDAKQSTAQHSDAIQLEPN